jgi:hypothetical protein
MPTLTAYPTFVHSGLAHLLSYALEPNHAHSSQWVSAISTIWQRRQVAPTYRCTACGGILPNCRCWQRSSNHA